MFSLCSAQEVGLIPSSLTGGYSKARGEQEMSMQLTGGAEANMR